jgi:site-specific DNA recombinase
MTRGLERTKRMNHTAEQSITGIRGEGTMGEGKVIAARIARKSNDEGQKSVDLKSVQLQLDEMAKFAASKGWVVDEKYTYVDDGISGADFVNRAGLHSLMAALDVMKPPFKIVLVTEPERLGRNTARALSALQDIEELGAEVWATAKGRQIWSEDIGTIVEFWAGSQERVKVIERVNRALNTRFEKGLVSGGRVYGYRNERVEGVDKAVRRVIDPAEAAVVTRIFERKAAGHGLIRIAKDLQKDNVPSPTRITEIGRQRRDLKNAARIEAGLEPLKPIVEKWSSDGIAEILQRELYRGVVVRGQVKRAIGRGGKKIRIRIPESEWKRQADESARIISDDLWTRARDAMKASSQKFLRVHNKLVGRPENFRGKHLLSNIARCGHCGAPMHAIARGRNLRLGYVCSANRISGSCLNASSAPADELHRAIMENLKATFTAKSFEDYLANRAVPQSEVDERAARLAELNDVVLPDLARRQERLLDAVESGVFTREEAKKRADKIRDEREAAEAEREELQGWVRDAAADRAQAQELATRWSEWQETAGDDPVVARQMLAKALGGAPIYITPGAEKRTWFFLGLASYEGVLRGAVRPGGYAVQPDEVPHVNRGAVPQAVQEALARLATIQGTAGQPLPKGTGKDGAFTVEDWKAFTGVPSWACGRTLKADGKRSAAYRPIAGGSDAGEFNAGGVTSGAPM